MKNNSLWGEIMEVKDVRGMPIHKGVHVRYTGTGSAGEALDFKSDDEGKWVLLDTTELWYNTDFLEVIDENEYEKIKNKTTLKGRMEQKELEGKEKIDKIKSKGKLEDVDMSNELCDGGG